MLYSEDANGFAFCVVTFCISFIFCDDLFLHTPGILDVIMICMMNILFKDIKVN